MKTGLVLEGGGMRGLYTVGVLDCFLDRGFMADYVVGVSAGACNGASYVSKQRGRGRRVNLDYLDDKRYLSLYSFLKTKSVFGMDFLFDEIPNQLEPFDYQTFFENPTEFWVGVTDIHTGKPVYFDKSHCDHDCTVLRASSSIPVFSPVVAYQGGEYLDGGSSDPIPIEKALADGCDRLIVVRTRDRSYQNKPESFHAVYGHVFRHAPAMRAVLEHRHERYNQTLEKLSQLEKEGVASVIAPREPVTISRFEKSRQKLDALYKDGMADGQIFLHSIGWKG